MSREGIAPGRAVHSLDQRAEAERAAVMGTAVADPVQRPGDGVADDADLAAVDAGDHAPLTLEVRQRADVDPTAHAATRPSRSP